MNQRGEDIRELLLQTAERAASYLKNLSVRNVAPDKESVKQLSSLEIPFPDHPVDSLTILQQLDDVCSPATMAMAGPRFFGFVIGGSLPASLSANWLATAWDQNTAFNNVTPATSILEKISLNWMLDVLRLPTESAGAFVTGTTVANFTALAAARHAVLAKAGWDVEAHGLFNAPPITVLVSAEAHPTLFKSLGMLGLGRDRVVKIPVDTQGRIIPDALPPVTGPAIVCLQAGNINTGAFDPVWEICNRIRRDGIWIHVDGAFGLWVRASESLSHLAEGIELADSWATDAHKWLNVPYDSGVAFVRDANSLRSAMSISAEYLPSNNDDRNPAAYTPELSRRARGVEIWAALRSLGRSGLSDLIERNCRYARRFADELTFEGYDVLNDVVINQVLVSFGEPETTGRIVSEIQNDGTCWCGITKWQGQTAMRISVTSWATTDDAVEKSIRAILNIAAQHRKS